MGNCKTFSSHGFVIDDSDSSSFSSFLPLLNFLTLIFSSFLHSYNFSINHSFLSTVNHYFLRHILPLSDISPSVPPYHQYFLTTPFLSLFSLVQAFHQYFLTAQLFPFTLSFVFLPLLSIIFSPFSFSSVFLPLLSQPFFPLSPTFPSY